MQSRKALLFTLLALTACVSAKTSSTVIKNRRSIRQIDPNNPYGDVTTAAPIDESQPAEVTIPDDSNTAAEASISTAVIAAIVGGLVLVILAIVGFFCYRKHNTKNTGMHQGEEVA